MQLILRNMRYQCRRHFTLEKRRFREHLSILRSFLQKEAEFLKKSNGQIVDLLGVMAEYRNQESGEHIQRIKGYTKILAEQIMEGKYGIENMDAKYLAEDLVENDTRRAAEELFSTQETVEEITLISQLPGLDPAVVEAIKAAGFDEIESFIDAYDNGSLDLLEGVSKEQIENVNSVLNEYVEIEDEEPEVSEDEASEEEEYFCPECNTRITADMTKCPHCGVEISFEEE